MERGSHLPNAITYKERGDPFEAAVGTLSCIVSRSSRWRPRFRYR
jgi:hypothetical protein